LPAGAVLVLQRFVAAFFLLAPIGRRLRQSFEEISIADWRDTCA